jgi:tripeptide aminopeptidase
MNRAYLAAAEQLVMELLGISGASRQEAAVMKFIADRLRKAGAPAAAIKFDDNHRRSPQGGECGNLVLKLPGTRRGPRRMLSAHVDTVPLCQGARPVKRDGRIAPADKSTGLGADDRAGTAVVLAAALEILERKLPHPPLTFLWTVQEEIGLYGARFANLGTLGKPKLAFNFDGGPAAKVTFGATGGYRMDVRIHGLASHAGVSPEKGVSAIAIAGLAIAQLQREGWHGRVEKHGRLGTSNIGAIKGGDATNVVTPQVDLRIEARSHDSAFRSRIILAIEKAFAKAAKEVRSVDGATGRVEIKGRLDYESFRLADDEPSVLAAEEAVRAAGLQPIRAISNGGLDANWLTARGIPTVTLGCGQENVHTTAERLHLGEFRHASQIALCLASGGE